MRLSFCKTSNMKRIEQKVSKFISLNKMFIPGDKVMIACSGGPDSVFLLNFLEKYRRKYKIDLCVVHFNHNLRGKESDSDEEFVENLCRAKKIPLVVAKLDVKSCAKKLKISIEEAARKLRYVELEKLSADLGCTKIATAHNLSDNTETILINLFSGTGGNGLRGIPVRRGKIIRPILSVTKNEIMEYLNSEKIKYRIDSSNKSNDFKRNFIRNRILPEVRSRINSALDDALFRSSINIENEIKFSKDAIEFFINKFVKGSTGSVRILIKLTNLFNGEIPGLILKETMHRYFAHEFEYDDYLKINSLIGKQKGKRVEIGNRIIAFREGSEIKIERVTKQKSKEIEFAAGQTVSVGSVNIGIEQISKKDVKFGGSGRVEFISAEGLSEKFSIRSWNFGDKFKPLGMKNFKKVSDFLTDCKIPTSERKNHLILLNRNHIVWVVGLRIDDRVKLNSKTKTVYKLWMN